MVTEQVEQIKEMLKNCDVTGDLVDLGEDLEELINHLTRDAKNALKHLETIIRFIVKFVIAWTHYALDQNTWKGIGYYGPRPNGKVFVPPAEILEKKIAMDCDGPVDKPQLGKKCLDPEDPFQKSPYHNCEYETHMKEVNRFLKNEIKDIHEFPENDEADICIIGTGPGGGALAYTLSSQLKGKGKKIVVLERGELYTSDEFNQLEKDMILDLFQRPPVRFTDDFGIGFYQGNLVGGSAVLSACLCFELPGEATKTWDRDVASDLKKGNYYGKVKQMIHYKKLYRTALNKNARLLLDGVKKLGKEKFFEWAPRNTHPTIESRQFPSVAGRHQLTCVGCGFCTLGCKYNRKQSPQITYIPAAIKNGVKVFKNANVAEVLYENEKGKKKITGVRVERGIGKADLIIKTKRVVVSEGAVNSSQLLMKSGIENPHLGKNIGLHPCALVYGRFNEDVFADWGALMGSSYKEFQFPKGNPEIFPDNSGYVIEPSFNPPAITAFSFPLQKIKQRMKDYEKITMVGVMLRDSSQGEIKKRHGMITPVHYPLSDVDKNKLRHGIRTAAHFFLEAGAQEAFSNHEKELLFRKDHKEEDLKKADTCSMEPGDIILASAHPQGGCKMGNPGSGVVDFNGHSYDVNNLYVCDASLFPTAIGVNPQLTIMALATKIGEHLASEM